MANLKSSEILKNPGKILYNRYVMYFILLLAIADLMFLAVGGETFMIALFVLVGFVTSFFSKNMVVIMTVAMALTNIVRFGATQRIEGLDNQEDEEKEKEKKKEGMEDEEGMENEKTGVDENAKTIELAKSIEKVEQYAPLIQNFQEMVGGYKELMGEK